MRLKNRSLASRLLKKSIFFSFLLVISFSLYSDRKSSLEFTWFGTTCLNISDGKTSLFFDPFITRPGYWAIASFKKLSSDKKLVEKWLGKVDKKQIKGIFVSHTHYDHALDLIEVHRQTNAPIYGSQSALNIALGGGISAKEFVRTVVGKKFKIGEFTVTILSAKHGKHFLGMTLADDKIDKPLKQPATAYDYKMGELFSYLIEHPRGDILFHPSGATTFGKYSYLNKKVSTVILGITQRSSSKDLIEKVIIPFGAKTVILVHHDNLFTPLSEGKSSFWLAKADEFYKTMKSTIPRVKILDPNYGEALKL